MTQVRVIYHQEAGSWWADSPDLDGFVAAADTIDQLRELVREGVAFHQETDVPEDLLEVMDTGAPVVTVAFWSFPGEAISEPTSNPSRARAVNTRSLITLARA